MWKIDRDYIAEGDEPSRVGTTGDLWGDGVFDPIQPLPADPLPLIRFRLLDDDGEVYYGGVLHDDDECLNQAEASRFGTDDAGAIWIEVKRDGKWVQEIA
jgi:hypothetical protein